MKTHRSLRNFLLILLPLMICLIPQLKTTAQTQNVAYSSFTDEFDNDSNGLWYKADGWTNGGDFACGWRTKNANLSGGLLILQLDDSGCPEECSGQPYASGEYRTNGFYGYGTYTVVMKAAASSGIVSSFFLYTGESDGNPHNEIDIEILGKDPTKMQTNYYAGDEDEGHETMVNLGFDASKAFHTYTIIWMPEVIEWYVDGTLRHTEDGSRGALPTTPGRIMMNLWPGTDNLIDWLGKFVYKAPLSAQYDSVSYRAVAWQIKSFLPFVAH